jgi:hypothetical protein
LRLAGLAIITTYNDFVESARGSGKEFGLARFANGASTAQTRKEPLGWEDYWSNVDQEAA